MLKSACAHTCPQGSFPVTFLEQFLGIRPPFWSSSHVGQPRIAAPVCSVTYAKPPWVCIEMLLSCPDRIMCALCLDPMPMSLIKKLGRKTVDTLNQFKAHSVSHQIYALLRHVQLRGRNVCLANICKTSFLGLCADEKVVNWKEKHLPWCFRWQI